MGCDSIIHFTVLANTDTSCQHHLWVPNIFTPLLNGNNRFRVISDNVTKMEVNIFQRWGDWVCTFDGLTEGWDGTKNSSPCPEGTYVYLIRYATPCQSNPKPIVGTITILY
jgi:gliding motility-associated-like protein